MFANKTIKPPNFPTSTKPRTKMFKQTSRPALFVLAAIALCIPVKGDISIAKGPTSPTEHLTVIAQFETTQPRGDADYL